MMPVSTIIIKSILKIMIDKTHKEHSYLLSVGS